MVAGFEIAFATVEAAEAATASLACEGFGVELRINGRAPASVVATLTLPFEEFDAALLRMQSLAARLGGDLLAHWQSEWDSATNRAAARNGVRAIRLICRQVAQGQILPEEGINRIERAAAVSTPPGPLEGGWAETRIWPIYRRFRTIALRWADAQRIYGVTNVPQEQLEKFRRETLEAARDLLP